MQPVFRLNQCPFVPRPECNDPSTWTTPMYHFCIDKMAALFLASRQHPTAWKEWLFSFSGPRSRPPAGGGLQLCLLTWRQRRATDCGTSARFCGACGADPIYSQAAIGLRGVLAGYISLLSVLRCAGVAKGKLRSRMIRTEDTSSKSKHLRGAKRLAVVRSQLLDARRPLHRPNSAAV